MDDSDRYLTVLAIRRHGDLKIDDISAYPRSTNQLFSSIYPYYHLRIGIEIHLADFPAWLATARLPNSIQRVRGA